MTSVPWPSQKKKVNNGTDERVLMLRLLRKHDTFVVYYIKQIQIEIVAALRKWKREEAE